MVGDVLHRLKPQMFYERSVMEIADIWEKVIDDNDQYIIE